ncbi:MAG TPA: MBL fold metallo-hydrolase, partial [Cyclobacteriaceae bacterium]|nr:MBL fold metallo-hydrolase [Cyclobacteriaceae bacterium]
FQNLFETRVMAENTSFFKIGIKFFSKGIDREPPAPIPSIKTDLKKIKVDQPTIIWFGHSSYLVFIEGKKILVDPVFSSSPSPIQAFGKKYYEGSSPFNVEDLPDLDIVLITHDHYDHLDYDTILKLKSKTKLFCATLGVGAHLNHWGVSDEHIIEFDRWQTEEVLPGIQLTATPARHFSGRLFKRFQTLWASYVLQAGKYKIFIGSDSGYDDAFKMIGEKYGPFDFALLECGQYNTDWPSIHMTPEETAQASIDLKAKVFMPVHWGKFTLSLHPWNDPIKRVTAEAERLHVNMTTPMIGEPVILGDVLPTTKWWEQVVKK